MPRLQIPQFPETPLPITTSRLIMRPLVLTDLDDVWKMRSNPTIMQWSRAGVPDASIEVTRDFMQKWITPVAEHVNNPFNIFTYAVSEKGKEHRVIGVVGLPRKDVLPEVGYMMHPDCWGKGYATEALQAFMQTYWDLPVAQEDIDVEKIHEFFRERTRDVSAETIADYGACAATDATNIRSCRVMEKCGFRVAKQLMEDDVLVLEWLAKRPKVVDEILEEIKTSNGAA